MASIAKRLVSGVTAATECRLCGTAGRHTCRVQDAEVAAELQGAIVLRLDPQRTTGIAAVAAQFTSRNTL
jgi:hypothetical protein